MNRTLLLTTALATALAALPAPMPVVAASDGALLLRCRMPDGTTGYTDRSCAVFGAQAQPIDAELVSRIVRDRAYEARLQATAAGAAEDFDMASAMLAAGDAVASADMATGAPGRRSPVAGCARSPGQLANDLHASVALGDVNRIAESYHFAGMSTAAGERVLDRLQHYAGRPVVDSQYYPGSLASSGGGDGFPGGAPAMSGADAPGMMQLVVASAGGDGGGAVTFDVHRYEGCYFVSFA